MTGVQTCALPICGFLGAFFFTFAGGSMARPPELGGASAMDGGERGRREGRGRVWGKWRQMGVEGLVSPTDRRATGGIRACVEAVRARPFHPKPSASLGRGWVESGRNPDICPFEAARWTVSFVRFTPNGRGRTG